MFIPEYNAKVPLFIMHMHCHTVRGCLHLGGCAVAQTKKWYFALDHWKEGTFFKIRRLNFLLTTKKKVSLVLLLVLWNSYFKKIATNTHPWGWKITIHIHHLKFHINFSFMEKNKGLSPLILWCIPKNRVPLISTNHDTPFLWAPVFYL